MKYTDDDAFNAALQLAGIQTTPYVRDLIIDLYKCVKKKKGSMSLHDFCQIEAKMCEKHGLDIKTKQPYKHKNKKFFIIKFSNGKMLYNDQYNNFTDDINLAHDFKSFDFAEKMIAAREYTEVMILPYYI